MKALVTGGAGFIGSYVVDKLIEDGHKVLILDDFSGGFQENLNPAAKVAHCDIRDYDLANTFIQDFRPEIVYHLAANAAENKAQFAPIDVTSRNYDASIKVLTAAINAGAKKIIYVSSIAVYGHGQTPFKVTDVPKPEDLYGITKLAFEESLHVMAKVHGFEYAIVRPHNVYGPRQNMTDPYRNVVTIFMNHLMKKEPLPIYGDGKQVRQFTFVKDIVDQIVHAESGITNIGSNTFFTINQLADAIEKVSGIKTGKNYLDARPQEVRVAISDNIPCKTTSLIDGLKETWTWCLAKGPQPAMKHGIEIQSKKMPDNWK